MAPGCAAGYSSIGNGFSRIPARRRTGRAAAPPPGVVSRWSTSPTTGNAMTTPARGTFAVAVFRRLREDDHAGDPVRPGG